MVDLKQLGNKVADYLMFREGTEGLEGEVQPVVTTGSIVWGVILRSAIIIVISFFLPLFCFIGWTQLKIKDVQAKARTSLRLLSNPYT